MIADPQELEELIATTQDLIDHNPWEIVLSRSAWERVPGGGTRPGTPVVLPAKRLYFGATAEDSRIVNLSEGEQIVTRYVLVGMPDEDIQEKDIFQIGTQKFKVIEVHPDRQYETRAWVVEYS